MIQVMPPSMMTRNTSASVSGQPDSWRSAGTGTNPAGTSFTHRFDTPGRYQYVCLQHRDFMKGTVEVGTDAVIDSLVEAAGLIEKA